MANKAEAYCTCPTKQAYERDPRTMHKYTSYRRVEADDEGICVDCGYYVKWGYESPKYSKPSWDACHSNKVENNRNYNWHFGMEYYKLHLK